MNPHFGYPVEIVSAMVGGKERPVGMCYQWADGRRRTRWDVRKRDCDPGTIRRDPLPELDDEAGASGMELKPEPLA